MAAALAVPGATRIRKRSFFFSLSGDQREFLFPGGNKERLTLSTLSLGFGARDDVHVLEAEGAKADWENVKMVVQTTTMLGVQPSLPAVTLTSTVLALPVIFRLRSGPGPLYVSGSHLVGVEDAAAVAPVMAAAKSLPKAAEEPAQKRASVSSEEPAPKRASVSPLVAKVEQNVNKPLSYPTSGPKYSAIVSFAAKYGIREGRSLTGLRDPELRRLSTALAGERDPEVRKYYQRLKDDRNEQLLEGVKAKIMEGVTKGARLSLEKLKFERYLKSCHNVTDRNMVAELWKWRQTLK